MIFAKILLFFLNTGMNVNTSNRPPPPHLDFLGFKQIALVTTPRVDAITATHITYIYLFVHVGDTACDR
jgi:hypothetical protein